MPPGLAPAPIDGYLARRRRARRRSRLRRLDNVVGNPAVSFLADHYDEDCTDLVGASPWQRPGRPLPGRRPQAQAALRAHYPQYAECPRPARLGRRGRAVVRLGRHLTKPYLPFMPA
jgi:hypothetical protein